MYVRVVLRFDTRSDSAELEAAAREHLPRDRVCVLVVVSMRGFVMQVMLDLGFCC